jgi:hypothetical protein
LDEQFAGKLVEHFFRPHLGEKIGNYPLLRPPALPVMTTIPDIIGNISGRL